MNHWVAAANELSLRVLMPAAKEVDRTGLIPSGHFAELASQGFYGIAFTSANPITTLAEVGEVLVSGCLSTAFVWAQHHTTMLQLATSQNARLKVEYLAEMQAGKVRAGISGRGYAKPASALVVATRITNGYLINGAAPFVSGWNGLTEVIGIAAYDAAGEKSVTFLANAFDERGLTSERLDLSAAHATNTVRLLFEDFEVTDDMVMSVAAAQPNINPDNLSTSDRAIVRINGSLALGTVRRCLRELAKLGSRNETIDARYRFIKELLERAVDDRRIDIYGARAIASRLAVDAADYFANISGSRAILRGETAEWLLREATFALVCTTTQEMKKALIDEVEHGTAESSITYINP